MAGNEEVRFTFGVDAFKKGLNQVVGFFSAAKDKIIQTTKRIGDATTAGFKGAEKGSDSLKERTAAVSKGVFSALGKFALIGGAIVGAFAIARNAINSVIPEVGQAFTIAKDIFFRNFLFPLRKALLPVLNRVLEWVRQNRAEFVRWGSIVANVFRVVLQGARILFKILSGIFGAVRRSINEVFGTGLGSLTQTVNLVIFKLASVFTFLETLIGPAVAFIGASFTEALKIVKAFGSGFAEALSGLFAEGDKFLELGDDLKKAWGGVVEILGLLEPAFKGLGKVIGTVVVSAIKNLISVVGGLFKVLGNLIDAATGEKSFKEALLDSFSVIQSSGLDVFKNLKEGATGAFQAGKKGVLGSAANFQQRRAGGPTVERVNDLIISNGRIFQPSPRDTIAAFQSPAGLPGGGKQITITFGDIIATVTEGNARAAGENIAEGIGRKLRQALTEDLLVSGGRL